MSNQVIHLGPSEVVEGRNFANPAGGLADLITLQYMVEALSQFVRSLTAIPDYPRPLIHFLEESGTRLHRLALVNADALLQARDLTVVGFCGQKRGGIDHGPLHALDVELVAELPQYPGLLSYSTLHLEDGNACNLVLFSQPQAIQHWATSKKHAQAVQMSSGYYESIRLHHGRLAGDLTSNSTLILLRTKYFDYRHQPVWRAVRELQGRA